MTICFKVYLLHTNTHTHTCMYIYSYNYISKYTNGCQNESEFVCLLFFFPSCLFLRFFMLSFSFMLFMLSFVLVFISPPFCSSVHTNPFTHVSCYHQPTCFQKAPQTIFASHQSISSLALALYCFLSCPVLLHVVFVFFAATPAFCFRFDKFSVHFILFYFFT